MGEVAFTKVQFGKEGTRGTAVPATARWPGTIKVPIDRKIVFPEAKLGMRARSQRSSVRQILADGITLNMESGVFQKLPWLFGMGLKGGVTASEVTPAQKDYLWDFSPSLTAANSPDASTIEYGDDTQAYEIEYCMVKKYKISGKVGEDGSISVEAELFGKQITPTAFTAAIANTALSDMVANMVKVWIDPAWATLGATQKTDLLREYSIEIITGVYPKFNGQGSKMMTGFGESYLDCMATFTFEGNSDADAQFDFFQAGTARAIRVQALGPQIGTGTPHSLTVDMFGTWEQVVPLGGEKNGDNLHTAVFHVHSDGLATPHSFIVKVTTDQSTI
jgi:hypothetical protein